MTDYRLSLMAGIDIPIPELQLTVHVPTIKDIAYMGEQQFFTAIQYICLDKESLVQDETLLASLTNFQVLMKVLEQSQDKDKKIALITLLKLLFPEYTAMITKNSIILTAMGESAKTALIDDSNFAIFQQVMREVLCVSSLFQGENIIYNPANDRAKEIADKIMRNRRKVAEQKGKSDESILTRYISILTVAQVATLSECSHLNMFQLFDLIERYTAFVEWDTDLKVRLAGGKPEKQVESWMRELHPNK